MNLSNACLMGENFDLAKTFKTHDISILTTMAPQSKVQTMNQSKSVVVRLVM